MVTEVNTNLTLHIAETTDVKNIVIYNQEDNTEAFVGVQYLDSASVSDDKKMMEHPKEDGTTIIDHIIDDAKTANISVLISDDDSTVREELLAYYKNCTPVMIKIKNEFFNNFVMSSKPVKADVSHYDTTVYELTFKEVLVAQTQYVKMRVPQVQQKKNASTVNTGHKQAQQTNNTSILAKIKKKVGL